MESKDVSDTPDVPSSEVGCEGHSQREESNAHAASSRSLLCSMEALLSRLLKTPVSSEDTNRMATQLVRFDPDEKDADIEGWCKITEIVVNSRKLDGAELLLTLTHALRGRAATCLTKLKTTQLTWMQIKELLVAKFGRPMLPQDYFDEILRFQIGSKESASEAATRVWSMIERIPRTEMAEDVITGFVASVLCRKDDFIRRELQSCNVSTRAQLLRVLNGISLKRKYEGQDSYESGAKRSRYNETRFSGTCHWCGISGHRAVDCRKRREAPVTRATSKTTEQSVKTQVQSRPVVCYVCGQQGHVASVCPDRKVNKETPAVREVHLCERRPATGIFTTSTV
ncbi:uncharacterized protein LOC111351166 [Spodoptera litura]|uniref:Uncharacterized protein LOC111351166 n=1 Tax=Spodoptera litura TaxID=69820 RepID=A0A9J7DUK7_SPOLT|nr:uncharacterized protein LOC111351166 [Spodoptera litura]